MTNLSNLNLLDENVGQNLKNERLQKTSMIAENPNADIQQNNVPQNNVPQTEMKQRPMPQMQERKHNAEAETAEYEQIPNNLPIRDYGKKQVDTVTDDKKILGMKPALFYTILGVAVIVGGYIAYKKFSKKGKTLAKAPSNSGSELNTGASSKANVSESTSEAIKGVVGEVPIT